MSDAPPGVKFTFLDYVGLAFILVGGEEILRRPKEGWPIWIPGFVLGLTALLFRDRRSQLVARLLAWFRAPNKLDVALAENAGLKKRLAESTETVGTAKISKLVIHWANYRAVEGGGEEFQVGEFLRQIISGDSLVFDIENHSFVIGDKNYVPRDPLWGKEKRLQVNYSYAGSAPVTTERREHGRLLLPEDSKITWLWGELKKAKQKPDTSVKDADPQIEIRFTDLRGKTGSSKPEEQACFDLINRGKQSSARFVCIEDFNIGSYRVVFRNFPPPIPPFANHESICPLYINRPDGKLCITDIFAVFAAAFVELKNHKLYEYSVPIKATYQDDAGNLFEVRCDLVFYPSEAGERAFGKAGNTVIETKNQKIRKIAPVSYPIDWS